MKLPKPLGYKSLMPKVTLSRSKRTRPKTIKPSSRFVGQKRALEALLFGIGIKKLGYNLYAMGPLGLGKRALVTSVLKNYASNQDVPPDWCYLYNFLTPERPIPLSLPAGMGIQLQRDMQDLIYEVGSNILSVYESDVYRHGMKVINKNFEAKRKKYTQNETDTIPTFYRERHDKEEALKLKLMYSVIHPIITDIKKQYKKFPGVLRFLTAVQTDILIHIDDFIKKNKETDLFTLNLENPRLTKYKINLLVDNSHLQGAPILFEQTPSYSSLICRVEHMSQRGNLVTNFSLIKAGALHKANGGYLIIEARKLRNHNDAWEALKTALYSNTIKIDPIKYSENDSITPLSLEPVPIPLNIKIILLGDRNIYYCMCDEDPDFSDLFKVTVDFNDQIDRDERNLHDYANMIKNIAQEEKLRPFQVSAITELLNFSSRLAEDNQKLSILIRHIEDLMMEADYWASAEKRKLVTASDVKQAIRARNFRMDRSKDSYYEDILREFIIINTEDQAIGQVNCLSVRRVGTFTYGHPTRVTARVRFGKGKLIDIQREIKMAGSLHSKAGLIISNYLATFFNQDQPFSLHASLAFEQIYVWTDGDSASIGELCALLSALAQVPINQFLAVTGSVDQYGHVQSIGGINEKIEGFFDVCKAKGLSGRQGVLIPAVNQQNLVLREDVIQAVKQKKFFVYPINTVEEALSLLTDMPAGVRKSNGEFTAGSVYYLIEERFKKFIRNKKSRKICRLLPAKLKLR